MKKLCGILLVLALLLVMPFKASAYELKVDKAQEKETENADGTLSREDPVLIVSNGSEEITSVKVRFVTGSAVKNFTCEGAGDFITDGVTGENGNYSCEFKVPSSSTTGTNIQIGVIKYVVDKNANEQDCSIGYSLETAEGQTPTPRENSQTGSMVPYLALGAGAVLAIGLIVATSNKTKFQKI